MAQAVIDIDSIEQKIDPIEERPSLVIGEPGLHGVTEAVARPIEWKIALHVRVVWYQRDLAPPEWRRNLG